MVWHKEEPSVEEMFSGESRISGPRIRQWAEEKNIDVNDLREAWDSLGKDRRSTEGLSFDEFKLLVGEASVIAREKKASLLPPVVGAVAGGIVAGPLGALAMAGLGGAYVASDKNKAVIGSAAVGGLVGGPVGLVAGGLVASRATKTYLGDPVLWPDYEMRAKQGDEERRIGLGDFNERQRPRESAAGLAVCGSGGGLRAATAFLGALAEAETEGLLQCRNQV